jgi:hypothetical protein
MRHPQLLVCERERRLSEMLRDLARERRWVFRSRHQTASCLRLLRRPNPTVLVLRVGQHLAGKSLEREFKLLERVGWLFPDTRTVAVSDVNDPGLTALAWDLGAAYVLPLSQSRDLLPEVVVGLMKSALQAQGLEGKD